MVLVKMLPGRQMEGMLWLVKDVSALFAWHDAFRRPLVLGRKFMLADLLVNQAI